MYTDTVAPPQMEYYNLQTKREMEGVPYAPTSSDSREPTQTTAELKESLAVRNTPFSQSSDDLHTARNPLLATYHLELNELDLPYGHIKSRTDAYLDDEMHMRDAYTTTSVLLTMTGISAFILLGMVAVENNVS